MPNPIDIVAGSELAVQMKACPQDPRWHPEGDVWVHTQMVYDHADRLSAHLPETERQAVLWAAALHDCGKPERTSVDGGRITSPGHSAVGARKAMSLMMAEGIPGNVRDMAYHLIMMHGWPPGVFQRDGDIETEVMAASLRAPCRALYALSAADARGRGGDPSDMIDSVELWRMAAEEMGCLEKAFHFPSMHSMFMFGQTRDPQYSKYVVPFYSKCEMTLMCGLPAAGKDTYLRSAENVVSLDQVRDDLDVDPAGNQGSVRQEARKRVATLLASGADVTVNATNVTRSVRDSWVSLGRMYGAKITIVYVDPGREDGKTVAACLARNAGRDAPVPTSVITALADKLEPPVLGEAHLLVTV